MVKITFVDGSVLDGSGTKEAVESALETVIKQKATFLVLSMPTNDGGRAFVNWNNILFIATNDYVDEEDDEVEDVEDVEDE